MTARRLVGLCRRRRFLATSCVEENLTVGTGVGPFVGSAQSAHMRNVMSSVDAALRVAINASSNAMDLLLALQPPARKNATRGASIANVVWLVLLHVRHVASHVRGIATTRRCASYHVELLVCDCPVTGAARSP